MRRITLPVTQPKLLIALGFGFVFLIGCQQKPPEKPKVKLPQVFIESPVTSQVTDFEEYTGRLAAVKSVDVRARVSGYLDKVQFADGADIDDEAPLFQIDPRPFDAALKQAEATVNQMQIRLGRMKRQEERLGRLSDQKITTAEDLEMIKSQREETDAELQAAQANVDLAKLNLEFTEIRSPFAGRISRRLVDAGNLVKADDTLLATIVSLDPIDAYFDIDERTVLQIRRLMVDGKISVEDGKTMTVQLALADEDEFTLTGKVDFQDNQLSATTGTLRLRAQVDNPRKLLAPGMFVRVRLPIGQPHDAVMISEEALGSDQGHRFVYVVDANDDVEYRRIQVGRVDGKQRIVNDGLSTADRVIVKGLQRVRPHLKVAPVLPKKTEEPVQAEEQPVEKGNKLVSEPPEAPAKTPAVSIAQ